MSDNRSAAVRALRHLAGRPALTAAITGSLLASAPAALAVAKSAPSPKPTVAKGFTITKLAAMPKSATNCDDLARLDGHLFVACQNKTQSTGGGGNSTILEYADDGSLVQSWSIADKADGLTGDPLHHRLIITLNEDAKSHLMTLAPAAPAGQQLVSYTYSTDPGAANGTGLLHTGGGTDAVSVDASGNIYTSGSYGIAKTGTAVFRVALSPPTSASQSGVARLSPTFADDATATKADGSGTQKLKLIDVDSNAIVPYSSPRFGGQFVIDDQTAMDLVFSSDINAGTGLTVLPTPYGLDDIRWATTDGGSMYVVDKGSAPNGFSSLYRVTGPFVAGSAYASNDSIPDEVVRVDLKTGKLTPFIHNLQTAKGLVYLDAAGAEPALPLGAGGAAGASGSASGTAGATSGAPAGASGAPGTGTRTAAAASVKSASDSDTLAIVLGIIAVVLALGAGAMAAGRRRAVS